MQKQNSLKINAFQLMLSIRFHLFIMFIRFSKGRCEKSDFNTPSFDSIKKALRTELLIDKNIFLKIHVIKSPSLGNQRNRNRKNKNGGGADSSFIWLLNIGLEIRIIKFFAKKKPCNAGLSFYIFINN